MYQPEKQSELEQEFWKTLELIVGRDKKRTEKDVFDDVQDWVDKVVSKKIVDDDENLLTGNSKKTEDSGYGSGHSKNVTRFLHNANILKTDCKKKINFVVQELNAFLASKEQFISGLKVVSGFSHPYVRSRLEKLMGSNLISLTDRTYMQQLQERILENYANDMNKRIAAREANERERVKNLVLTGMIPLDDAPPEMIDHPVRLIEMYCRKLIAERREKIKIHKGFIPKRLYPDDTPDPPSGLAIEEGHMFRKREERLCHPPQCVLGVSDKDDIKRGYMFTDEQYAELKLEGSLIQQLREAQSLKQFKALYVKNELDVDTLSASTKRNRRLRV
ncbi:hypothetical protein RN001_008032 [Aquatica leii]|uniref:Uncharacterized protein n=1 Tax=Aquatica leii TaxID=1421715 RepID=A0AAN7S9E3_9COLE|nr:hypothetical protein RN001_008032 [Aquatica leii]